MKKQKGYTLIEVIIGIAIVAIILLVIAGVFVAGHFIAKFW